MVHWFKSSSQVKGSERRRMGSVFHMLSLTPTASTAKLLHKAVNLPFIIIKTF